MTAVAAFVLGTERCQVSSSWAQSSVKAQNVLYQVGFDPHAESLIPFLENRPLARRRARSASLILLALL